MSLSARPDAARGHVATARLATIEDPAEAELISAMDEGSLVHEILERFLVRRIAGRTLATFKALAEAIHAAGVAR